MLTKTRLLLCGGALSGMIWAGTFATFTDSGTAENSTFTAGSVDMVIGGEADDAYDFTAISMAEMKPGDVKYAPLTIANNGTLGFSYSMATTASNGDGKNLRDQLKLGVRKVLNAGLCDAAGYEAAVLQVMAVEGPLSGGTIASRSLAKESSEVACFKVELPPSSDDTFQGAATTATFAFSATQ